MSVMSRQAAPHPDYESLQWILNSISEWIVRYRQARGFRHDMMNCSAADVATVAHELGISPGELAEIANKGPHAADLLQKLLVALGVDAKGLCHDNPLVMRDLQRLCVTCGFKRRCKFDLDRGASAENFRDYCPNAFTLDALIRDR
jgi:transcriptional regulator with XRE-family HTH domain